MFYYKQLLETLNKSKFFNYVSSSIRDSISTYNTLTQQESETTYNIQPKQNITSNDTQSGTPAPMEIISLDDDDTDESVSEPDPSLYLNYNNKVFIYNNDLTCLKPQNWLNDSIMEYYYTELYQAALKANRNKASGVHISNSFFFSKLEEANSKKMNLYTATKAWMKDVNLFEKNLWLIPVCESNHWYLIVVTNLKHCIHSKSPKKCRIFLLDSLSVIPQIKLTLIINFLKAAAKANRLQFKMPLKSKLLVPQQRNGFDCGLYVLFFIKTIMRKQNRLLNNKSFFLKETTWRQSNFPTRKAILSSLRQQKKR